MEDDINQIHTETGILSICGIRPRSYPPLDALMETWDFSQVAQPLAEKGRLLVVSAFILIPFSTIFITQLAPLSLLSPYVSLCFPM